MRVTRKVTYPQVPVLNGTLTVPVRRVTYALQARRFTLSLACQAQPAVPEAFRGGSLVNPAAPVYLLTDDGPVYE